MKEYKLDIVRYIGMRFDATLPFPYSFQFEFSINGSGTYFFTVRYVNESMDGQNDFCQYWIEKTEAYNNIIKETNYNLHHEWQEHIYSKVKVDVQRLINRIKKDEMNILKLTYKVIAVKQEESTVFRISLRCVNNHKTAQVWLMKDRSKGWVICCDRKTSKMITDFYGTNYSGWRRDILELLLQDERVKMAMLF